MEKDEPMRADEYHELFGMSKAKFKRFMADWRQENLRKKKEANRQLPIKKKK